MRKLIGGGVCGAAHIVFDPFARCEVVKVVQVLLGCGAEAFQGFNGILADLRMWVTQGEGGKSGYGSALVCSEICELGQRRRGEATNLGGGHGEKANQLRNGGGVFAAAKLKGPLDECLMLLAVHVAVHGFTELASASGSEVAGSTAPEARAVLAALGL